MRLVFVDGQQASGAPLRFRFALPCPVPSARAAKAKLLPLCRRAVLNFDNPITRELAKTALPMGTPVTWFSLSPLPDGVLREGDSAVWLEPEDPLDPEDRGSGGRICTFFPLHRPETRPRLHPSR